MRLFKCFYCCTGLGAIVALFGFGAIHAELLSLGPCPFVERTSIGRGLQQEMPGHTDFAATATIGELQILHFLDIDPKMRNLGVVRTGASAHECLQALLSFSTFEERFRCYSSRNGTICML
jgi:hypothetical protein